MNYHIRRKSDGILYIIQKNLIYHSEESYNGSL